MKKHLIFLFMAISLASFGSNKDGYIEFRHVGECDKYITIIRIVTKEELSTDEKKVVVVDKETFNCLSCYLINGHKRMEFTEAFIKYGSFKIKIANDGKDRYSYYTEGRKQSLVFFQGILQFLKQHDLDKNIQRTIDLYYVNRLKNPPPVASGLE